MQIHKTLNFLTANLTGPNRPRKRCLGQNGIGLDAVQIDTDFRKNIQPRQNRFLCKLLPLFLYRAICLCKVGASEFYIYSKYELLIKDG